MRLCLFDGWRLGVWTDDGRVVDVSDHVVAADPRDRMQAAIEAWDDVREALAAAVAAAASTAPRAAEVRVRAPLPRPSKIVAAPINYLDHQEEMSALTGVRLEPLDHYGWFLKAPSSVIGPDEPVRLPFPQRRTDYEGELGVVIGRTARGVSAREALDHVFGYVPLLDITLRGSEDRSFRKSLDGFTPVGPAVVTADEVGDPGGLHLRLWLNGELRQHANTLELVYDVPRLVEWASAAMTLHPGDVIATGTPAGVGAIAPGDEIVLRVDRVGELTMRVESGGEA